VARSLPGLKHYGNDVTSYLSPLGRWAAGKFIPFTLNEAGQQHLTWLEPYLDTAERIAATVMLGTNFFGSVGKENREHERLDRWIAVSGCQQVPGTVSKNARMSKSITQSVRQHR
jgi:hypothetical protein